MEQTHRFNIFTAAFLAASCALLAQNEEGWNPDTTFPALPPAEAIKTIEVPKGYKLVCIASEPMVEEPAAMAFDGNGALYVCEWRTYMQDEHATGQLDPVSRVVKLVDTDGDGVMDKRTVFIDNVDPPALRAAAARPRARALHAGLHDLGLLRRQQGRRRRPPRGRVAGRPDNGNIEHQQSGLLWNLDNTICTNDRRFRWDNGKLPRDATRRRAHQPVGPRAR